MKKKSVCTLLWCLLLILTGCSVLVSVLNVFAKPEDLAIVFPLLPSGMLAAVLYTFVFVRTLGIGAPITAWLLCICAAAPGAFAMIGLLTGLKKPFVGMILCLIPLTLDLLLSLALYPLTALLDLLVIATAVTAAVLWHREKKKPCAVFETTNPADR